MCPDRGLVALVLLLGACTGPKPDTADTSDMADTSDTTDTFDTADTSDTSHAAAPFTVVLAGGGSEGENGDPDAWSARLYPALWSAGDVTGDGLVTVAVLSEEEETTWIPEYLVELGADAAFNLRVRGRAQAEAESLDQTFAEVDAVFLKGGDQGEYYDDWNGTRLERWIREVTEVRGGGVGGTSAGAMSMAAYAFAGGADLVSADALEDARTPYLDDVSDGGSGIHTDFFGFVPGVVIDTHFTTRGRLGRLAGILARVVDDHAVSAILGVGCEERTGVVIRDGVAEVVGVGSVSFLAWEGERWTPREAGVPLTFTDLRLDRLTDGWRYDLTARAVLTDHAPADAEAVSPVVEAGPDPAEWYADGDLPAHEERFGWVVERDPDPFGEHPGADLPVLAESIGVADAFDTDRRGPAEEALFRGLHAHPGALGVMLGVGGSAERPVDAPSMLVARDNPEAEDAPMASILVDTSAVSWRSLSPEPSNLDLGDGSLHAAGLVGARVHVLYTPASGLAYDVVARAIVER